MKKPPIVNKVHLLLIVALFAVGLAISSFSFYAKVRFFAVVVLNELVIMSVVVVVLYSSQKHSMFDEVSITRRLRLALLFVVLIYVIGFASVHFTEPEYITPRYAGGFVMRANSWSAVIVANVIGMTALFSLSVCLRILRSLILHRQKKNTAVYFHLMWLLGGLSILSAAGTGQPLRYDPSANHPLTFTLLLLTTALMFINMFRVGWLTVLNRRQKFMTFLGGIVFTLVTAGLHGAEIGGGVTYADMVNSYSVVAGSFLFLVTVFAFLYSLATTVVAFLHLPTAAIYDKKVREINSIYALSRTINSLFDFDKIVATVTQLVCEATNAQACWLEMATTRNPTSRSSFRFVASRSADHFRVPFLEVSFRRFLSGEPAARQVPSNDPDFRSYLAYPVETILEARKPFLINQVKRDRMTRDLRRTPIESLLAVPLISGEEVIGIIYAVKAVPFGFDQDDIAVVSAFANQTTVAIENARLVTESLEKERLAEELRIAHDVQMRLIPQEVPLIRNETHTLCLDIGAMTIPANEVGGDYYDFVKLADWRTGIVVGDVSGKGTSAAFYMAEIKGIIQSLAGIYSSPRDLLVAVNDVLFATLDRKTFITLIYVDFDISRCELHFARAGHCPLLHLDGSGAHFLQPNGIGLGLDSGPLFRSTIEDRVLRFDAGEVVVLYSDGLVEARNERGEEYGETRLCKSVESVRHLDALAIKDRIVSNVKAFVGSARVHDDLTCVVLKVRALEEARAGDQRVPGVTDAEQRTGGLS